MRVKGLNKSKISCLIEFKCLHNSSYLGLVYTRNFKGAINLLSGTAFQAIKSEPNVSFTCRKLWTKSGRLNSWQREHIYLLQVTHLYE